MFTGEEKQEWAYRCLMRPPVPGAIPREGLDRVGKCIGWTQERK